MPGVQACTTSETSERVQLEAAGRLFVSLPSVALYNPRSPPPENAESAKAFLHSYKKKTLPLHLKSVTPWNAPSWPKARV
ncbi:Hypothetical protein NTJ_02997 [Nesidiocoris tenuis]|uniref:Uncharacterized protein n=1 Tax=Nesidiocoris tenuis TaxID=355587 RepID=A0ABN7AD42_9HEMI|nr:Hypothetical protein NTJ_02997 [Nesidiocoris tenuis]